MMIIIYPDHDVDGFAHFGHFFSDKSQMSLAHCSRWNVGSLFSDSSPPKCPNKEIPAGIFSVDLCLLFGQERATPFQMCVRCVLAGQQDFGHSSITTGKG